MKTSSVTILAALALAFSLPVAALASYPETVRNLDREIGMCVDRISRQADYNAAGHVVHRIVDAEQINLAEQEFQIDTLVLADDDAAVIRTYKSTCVTMGVLKVVRFRIEEVNVPAQAAGLRKY